MIREMDRLTNDLLRFLFRNLLPSSFVFAKISLLGKNASNDLNNSSFSFIEILSLRVQCYKTLLE